MCDSSASSWIAFQPSSWTSPAFEAIEVEAAALPLTMPPPAEPCRAGSLGPMRSALPGKVVGAAPALSLLPCTGRVHLWSVKDSTNRKELEEAGRNTGKKNTTPVRKA